MAANYNYFEGLTIRNTDLAFQAGLKNIAGSSGLTIKKCRFENVGRAIYTDWSGSKDYYIADNVMIGRFNPDYLMGFTGRTWQNLPEFNPKLVSEYAVKVYGSGHVVAYNYIANFHDGVDVATYGNPDGSPNPIRERMPVSIDFYGKHPDKTVALVAQYTGGSPAILDEAMRHSRWTYRVNVQNAINVAKEGPKFGFTKADMSGKVADYFDLSYLAEATGQSVEQLSSYGR